MASASDQAMISVPGQALQAPRRRAFHNKSRGGCLTCKKRHVRCDQARPHCTPCQRLQLKCVFTQDSEATIKAVRQTLKVLRPAQPRSIAPVSQPFWTPDETARAIVHDAFSRVDPTGHTGDNPFLWITRESYNNESYKYICLAMKDLSNSRNATVRQMGFLPLNGARGPGRPSAESKDPHVLSAVRNYTHAISIFRSTLGNGLPPREIACGTLLFAIIEAMRGNYTSQHTLMLAGVMLLRPSVSSSQRNDGSAIYGISHGDRGVLGVEALVLRSAAHARLSGKTKGKNSSPAQGPVPDFCLPTSFPTPSLTDSVSCLQHKWGVFHITLESWQLSRYWYIVAGVAINARRHLAEQDRFRSWLKLWLDLFRGLIAMTAPLPSTSKKTARTSDETRSQSQGLCDTWHLMVTYIQCLLLAMATLDNTSFQDSTSRESADFVDETPMNSQNHDPGEINRDLLRGLMSRLRSEINGFCYPANSTLNYDRLMLPLITAEAVEQLRISRHRTASAFVNESRQSSGPPVDLDECLSALQQKMPSSTLPSSAPASILSSSANSSSHTRSSTPILEPNKTKMPRVPVTTAEANAMITISNNAIAGSRQRVTQPLSVMDQQLAFMSMYSSIVKDIFQDHELAIIQGRLRDFPFMPLSVRKRFTLAGLLGPQLMEEWSLKVKGKGAGQRGIMV